MPRQLPFQVAEVAGGGRHALAGPLGLFWQVWGVHPIAEAWPIA